MTPDEAFAASYDWLDQLMRSDDGDHLTWLLAAGRLRLLVADAEPLMDQVNRSHKLKITYEVARMPEVLREFGDPVVIGALDGISPRLLPQGHKLEIVTLKRDAFLKEPILWYRDQEVTVLDLVRYAANVAGGVHVGEPRSPAEEKIHEMIDLLGVGKMPLAIKGLRGICAVVLVALLPLRKALIPPSE